MKSILGLSAAVALGLAAGLAILLWWMPTILFMRLRLAPIPAGRRPHGGRPDRSLDRGDIAEAERILARLARGPGICGRPGRAQGWPPRR